MTQLEGRTERGEEDKRRRKRGEKEEEERTGGCGEEGEEKRKCLVTKFTSCLQELVSPERTGV